MNIETQSSRSWASEWIWNKGQLPVEVCSLETFCLTLERNEGGAAFYSKHLFDPILWNVIVNDQESETTETDEFWVLTRQSKYKQYF